MAILKNSAKCDACGVEVESTHRHHFSVHYCKKTPRAATQWVGNQLVEKVPAEITWSFAVDGGKSYLRRAGEGFTDTSVFSDDHAGND